MAEHGDTAVMSSTSLHSLERKASSSIMDDSDKETDTFEDTFEDAANDIAPDTPTEQSSVRSLTQRSVTGSIPSASVPETKEQEKQDEQVPVEELKVLSPIEPTPIPVAEPHVEKPDPAEVVEQVKQDLERVETTSSAGNDEVTAEHQRLSVQSEGQLDEVSLHDESASDDEAKEQEAVKMSPSEPEPPAPKKTISLSSIASSLPAMPWSPGAQTSPKNLDGAAPAIAPKSPGTPPAISATPPALVLASAPAAPPTRKLAGAFSWLSRSSSRDLTNVLPPAESPRRNTASSTGTMASNAVDEEGRAKHTLKDRFKAMRLREEAGITSLPDDGEPNGIANLVNNGPNGITPIPAEEKDAVQPPPSPLSQNLRPGTASGATAGPTDQAVDWDLWQSVVNEGPAAVAKTSAEELSKAIATGIPSAIRGVIWQVLAQSQSPELEAVYRDLVARGTDKEKDGPSNGSLSVRSNGSSVKEPGSSASSVHSSHSGSNGPSSPPPKDATKEDEATRLRKKKEDVEMISRLEKVIRRDLGARTAYSKFASAPGLQEGLYGVCKAYALFDEDVGYAQGMNFLIMPLLFNMTEEEAFCLLVKLMNNYHLRELFIEDMPGLHMHLFQFERLLEDTQPALYCHLRRRGISPHLYATQWFLTLFSYRFPLQLVLRIYDLILSEGLSAILKFGIVLMQKNADTLLGMTDMSHLTNYLRDRLFDVYIESAPSTSSILENGFFGSSTSSMDKEVYRADQLVHDACEIKITPEVLQAYRTEWEEKTREEKERQQELETLRTQNSSYSSKIRKLEERLQAVDKEQAELATELVHTKVENEELKDQNESLIGQVRELKIVIEKQPVDIEDQWTLERNTLMQNNQRVHEENEKLEKECADLEEQLVATKMQYAEINAQHETLNRKWNDLKRSFA